MILAPPTTRRKGAPCRRNGITFNDTATLTEFFDLHDKYLTVTTLAYDPIYLTEPLVRTESFVWNPYQPLAPPHAYGAACQPAPELPRPYGWVPHHLPGTNTVVAEFSKEYGIPFEATRGGAETMYPEYREKLKTMTIPPPRIFLTKFEQEHEDTSAQKAGRQRGPRNETAPLHAAGFFPSLNFHPVSKTGAGQTCRSALNFVSQFWGAVQ
jgi:hypothetical protein